MDSKGSNVVPIGVVASPDKPGEVVVGQILEIPCERIVRLSGQPRLEFPEMDLNSLTQSIKEEGQLVPGIVTKLPSGKYQLIDGERRWRACKKLKRPFQAILRTKRNHDDEVEESILANFHRAEHTPIEKALAMKFLRDVRKTSVVKIAMKLGCSVGTVNNHLLILEKLDPTVLDFLDPRKYERPLRLTLAYELTAFSAHREEQVRLAKLLTLGNMPYQEGMNVIARQARKFNITQGRGRERRPSDIRESLETFLLRMGNTLMRFTDLTEFDFSQMFEFVDPLKHKRILVLAYERRKEIQRIIDLLETVSDPGAQLGKVPIKTKK